MENKFIRVDEVADELGYITRRLLNRDIVVQDNFFQALRGTGAFHVCSYRRKKSTPSVCGGQRYLRYSREHHKALYTGLQVSGKLNGYLADINRQARDMFLRLVEQMTEREGARTV